MFQLYCSILIILGIVAGDLLAWTIDDLLGFLCCQGVDGGLRVQDTHAAAVDSLELETVVEEPHSLTAPGLAYAIPGLALLAALALAVCWVLKRYRLVFYDLDEDLETYDFRLEDNLQLDDSDDDVDLEDSDDDMELEESDDEVDLEDSDDDVEQENSDDDIELEDSDDDVDLEDSDDDMEQENNDDDIELEDSDDDVDLEDIDDEMELEESKDYLDTDVDEMSRLRNRLELEDPEDSVNDLETDKRQLPRLEDLEQELEGIDLKTERTDVALPEESLELEELTGTEDGPEIVEQPNCLMVPAFAFAIPVLALLVGLAFAVQWNVNNLVNHLQELEEPQENEKPEEYRLEETLKLDLEKQRLKEELEESKVAADEMERLWKEAKEEIILLQNQMAEKDVLLRKNADQEAIMKSEIVNLHHQNEEILAEHQHLKDDLQQALNEGERMENLNNDLKEELESLEKECKEEMANKERELQKQIDILTKLLERTALESKKDQEKLIALEGQMASIEDTVSELESQIMDITVDQDALRGKLELKEEENARLKAEREKMENLNNDLKEELESLGMECKEEMATKERELQKQIDILTKLLERKALESKKDQEKLIALEGQTASIEDTVSELESQIMEITVEQDALQRKLELKEEENSRLKAETEIMGAKLQAMKNCVSELWEQNARLIEELEEKKVEVTSVKEELRNVKMKTQILVEEVQVMRKWVAELGGENSRLQEEVDENCLEITSLKKSLRKEKRLLEEALHHGKEMESLLEAEKKRGKEMETSLRILKEELDNRGLQMERLLNKERRLISEKEDLGEKLAIALNQGKELDRFLEEADEKARKIARDFEEEVQKRETQICQLLGQEQKLKEGLQQLGKECERLTEKCRMQEEHEMREAQRFREHQRRQEEALKQQDKYLLMTLLHGTAQRNFHLQHIALGGNEVLEETSEKETEDEGQKEDLSDLLRMKKENQFRNYCDAQRERTNYGRQWEVLTQTLTDLMHGDERMAEATNGGPNMHSGVYSEAPEQEDGETMPQDTILGRRSPN
ncbi:myosin-10-like [Macrobrachium nipponense]|uniref:myosin-10-like n=1 Tax=Macrobrachium nipponense TaxID=159736 RepID=UPI0030C7B9CB